MAMKLRNDSQHWGAVAKGLHWSVALAVLFMIGLGLIMTAWPISPIKLKMYLVHKSLGIVILAVMIVRLLWRLANPAPVLPDTLKPYERLLAHANHALLYILLLAMPISGWVINSAANFPLRVFGLFQLPQLVPPNKSLQELAEAVHFGLFLTIAVLLILHVAAALKHHFVLKDGVLLRMLPGRARRR